MNLLPFTIKPTDQATVRLCRVTPPERYQELNVDVDFLLRSWEIHHLHVLRESTRRNLTRQILSEVRKDAYAAFMTFLRSSAEPRAFLPMDLLARYPQRQYCLLLSPDRSRELFDIYRARGRSGQHLVSYSGYELIVNTTAQLSDTESYLIAPNKYTLFLRQSSEADEIKVYRSDFMDLTGNSPPPLDLHAQDVMDTVQNDIESETEPEPQYRQLLMFPLPRRRESAPAMTECPKCNGPVQRVGGESYFCLDCDWDNLPQLR